MSVVDINIADVINKFYTMELQSTVTLSGYEDVNKLVTCKRNGETEKYIFKIFSKKMSQQEGLLKSIADVLLRLQVPLKYEIPKPILTNEGHSVARLITEQQPIKTMLLTFVPGIDFSNLELTSERFMELCKNVGEFVGELDLTLQRITDPALLLRERFLPCMLENLPKTRCKLNHLDNKELKDACNQIIDELEAFLQIDTTSNNISTGLIHHDLILNNIMFKEDEHQNYTVAGGIDFFELCHSYYIFEIATTISNVLYHALSIEEADIYNAAAVTLRGFQKHFSLSLNELGILYTAVLSRLVVIVRQCCDESERIVIKEHVGVDYNKVCELILKLTKDGKNTWNELVLKENVGTSFHVNNRT